jgi:predicted outer membrane repeat protein
MTDVIFSDNTANNGGGMYLNYSNLNLMGVTFSDNTAGSKGGAIYTGTSSSIIGSYVLINNNYSEGHGAGIFISAGSTINLNNSTIASNIVGEGDTFGAGIYADGGTAALVNSIVYYNRREGDYGINYNLNGYTMDILDEYTVSYSDIEGDENWIPEGEGNISIAPEINDFENGDYNLQGGSPCIDTGIVIEDMEYCDSAPDMGAYEYCEEECGAELADVSGEGQINVLDIVQIANLILEISTPLYECAADYNQDGSVDILDLVEIINFILFGD